MKNLRGRIAVVTGAASGIGLALADKCAREGMKLVISDIDATALRAAQDRLAAETEVEARVTDVSKADDVEALAEAAYARFGAVHLLCNNAGVAPSSHFLRAWEVPTSDWDWVMAINVMGVVHGLRAFVPRMLAGREEGHVVNTASSAGFLAGSGPYGASKTAVVCLSEGLYHDLRAVQAQISASVLCPGHVRTQIVDAERNRSAAFGGPTSADALTPAAREATAAISAALDKGYPPSQVADDVIDAVRDDRFYVVPMQKGLIDRIHSRMNDILAWRNPPLR